MELNDYLYGAGREARNKALAAANDAWAARNEAAFTQALKDFAAASNGSVPAGFQNVDAASYAAQFGLSVTPPPPKSQPIPADLHSIAGKSNDPTLADVLKAIAELRALFVKAAGL